MIDPKIKNKVAIVTGGNHGIGSATSLELARQGAQVLITFLRLDPKEYGGISPEETRGAATPGRAYYYGQLTQTADGTLDAIQKHGGKAAAWETDLADPQNIPRLFEKAEGMFGPVDILVNNAAFDQPDTFIPPEELERNPLFAEEYPMQTLSAESHDRHFAVNSRAVALLTQEFAHRFILRQGKQGRIINISTDGAYAHACNVSYGASKLAMESAARAAAQELGPFGITVNVVSPGAIQTGWMPEKLERQLADTYPLRRVGAPEDIAKAVLFFASQQADWITGQVLFVGGGNRM
jgi:3-oxoacyl-[acyl-carrier protein] reductase